MNADHHRDTEERRIREAALDRTIEDSFPASDPPSSLPNPYDGEHDHTRDESEAQVRRGSANRG